MENVKAYAIKGAIWVGVIALGLLVFVGQQEATDFLMWVVTTIKELFIGIKTVIINVKNGI